VDLFVLKRRELEDRCPSGLYAIDVLWDKEKKCEMDLLEAVKVVVSGYGKKGRRQTLKRGQEEGEGGGGNENGEEGVTTLKGE
jgi:hypothetical protein